jgi:hypothetical protein
MEVMQLTLADTTRFLDQREDLGFMSFFKRYR